MASNFINEEEEDDDIEVNKILKELNLNENGSPIQKPSTTTTTKKVIFSERDQVFLPSRLKNFAGSFKFRIFDWNNEGMDDEFILEIFSNANNNFLPDIFIFRNLKKKNEISNLLANFNFGQCHNDIFKTKHVESIFFNMRYFDRFEVINRDNIFLKVPNCSEFVKLKNRFNLLLPLKDKFQKFSNFWKIFVVGSK